MAIPETSDPLVLGFGAKPSRWLERHDTTKGYPEQGTPRVPLCCGCLGDHPQVVGDQPPAHTPFHARVAMVATPRQPVAPFQPTDPPFESPPASPGPAETSAA